MYSDVELCFLGYYVVIRRLPPPEMLLEAAITLVAVLGGYSNRKGDPSPRHQIMWRGYDRLSMTLIGYRVFDDMHASAESGGAETKPRGSRKPLKRDGGFGGKASGKAGRRDHA